MTEETERFSKKYLLTSGRGRRKFLEEYIPCRMIMIQTLARSNKNESTQESTTTNDRIHNHKTHPTDNYTFTESRIENKSIIVVDLMIHCYIPYTQITDSP